MPKDDVVLERPKELADLVLIDTPPLLNSADGMLLASQVEAGVMAVSATQTRQDSMAATLENLRRANLNILGFVWNQMEPEQFRPYPRSQRHYRTKAGAPPHGTPSRNAAATQEAERLEPVLSAQA